MKTVKLFLLVVLVFLGSHLSMAQESKIEVLAKEKITSLNSDVQLNLDEEQEIKMYDIVLIREKKMESLKTAKLSKKAWGLKIAEIDIEFINSLQKILNESQFKKLIRSNSIVEGPQ